MVYHCIIWTFIEQFRFSHTSHNRSQMGFCHQDSMIGICWVKCFLRFNNLRYSNAHVWYCADIFPNVTEATLPWVDISHSWLILLVQRPKYSNRIRSIWWPTMPWSLELSGHQQPWYWLCRINRSLSSMMKDFNYLYHFSVKNVRKSLYMFMLLPNNSARKGLSKDT